MCLGRDSHLKGVIICKFTKKVYNSSHLPGFNWFLIGSVAKCRFSRKITARRMLNLESELIFLN